jgi:hypothetical protein
MSTTISQVIFESQNRSKLSLLVNFSYPRFPYIVTMTEIILEALAMIKYMNIGP